MVIESASSDVKLRFGPLRDDYVTVALSSRDHSASKRVYVYTDAHGIASLFQAAAVDWRGWDGARNWTSIEGDFSLSLEADHLGHVALTVLLSHDMGQPDPWRLNAVISLEAGQLQRIAAQAHKHFTATSAA